MQIAFEEPNLEQVQEPAVKKRKSFKCHFCERELLSSQSRYMHERSKHQDRMVNCPHADCKSQSVSVRWMESHLRSYHAEVNCDFCNKSFIHRSVLMEHIRVSHPCGHKDCTSFFSNWANLFRHMQRAHMCTVLEDQNQNVQPQPPSTWTACPSCGQPDDVCFENVVCSRCLKSFHCQALLDEHFLSTGGCITLSLLHAVQRGVHFEPRTDGTHDRGPHS
jgi:Zinc finger, C2H2 type